MPGSMSGYVDRDAFKEEDIETNWNGCGGAIKIIDLVEREPYPPRRGHPFGGPQPGDVHAVAGGTCLPLVK